MLPELSNGQRPMALALRPDHVLSARTALPAGPSTSPSRCLRPRSFPTTSRLRTRHRFRLQRSRRGVRCNWAARSRADACLSVAHRVASAPSRCSSPACKAPRSLPPFARKRRKAWCAGLARTRSELATTSQAPKNSDLTISSLNWSADTHSPPRSACWRRAAPVWCSALRQARERTSMPRSSVSAGRRSTAWSWDTNSSANRRGSALPIFSVWWQQESCAPRSR